GVPRAARVLHCSDRACATCLVSACVSQVVEGRSMRCTEWQPRSALWQFGSHRAAPIGELIVRNMNTNASTHTDLIWSFQFDKSPAPIIIVAVAVAVGS